MRKFLFLCLSCSFSCSFSQNKEITTIVNTLTSFEIPENFQQFYLDEKSYSSEKEEIQLSKIEKRKLLNDHPDFPLRLLDTFSTKVIHWKSYNLDKAKFFQGSNYMEYPKRIVTVHFVNPKTTQTQLDSLQKNRKPYEIYIKNNTYWTKTDRWLKVLSVWKNTLKSHGEEKYYFRISAPIFSEDKKYARIAFREQTTCKHSTSFSFFKKEQSTWKRVLYVESRYGTTITTTHTRCDEPLFIYQF